MKHWFHDFPSRSGLRHQRRGDAAQQSSGEDAAILLQGLKGLWGVASDVNLRGA